ncbi:hypothetical protein [Microvirga pakistanensis]|uniref:hypothetical protein n=1 Tax=Microvirga pakistanensis TaxID=1682650 RepID=UPI00141A72AE|nr:hypothetical protein [Microvirga pakistanensis]
MVINNSIDRLLKGLQDADPNNGKTQAETRNKPELRDPSQYWNGRVRLRHNRGELREALPKSQWMFEHD